jgi:hypothetical protein
MARAQAAGTGLFHDDPRIVWAIEQFGSVEGMRVLELGPLEAAHTTLFDRHGPAGIALNRSQQAFVLALSHR